MTLRQEVERRAFAYGMVFGFGITIAAVIIVQLLMMRDESPRREGGAGGNSVIDVCGMYQANHVMLVMHDGMLCVKER